MKTLILRFVPLILALVAIELVALPNLRVNPGRAQSEWDLAVGHRLSSLNPWITLGLLALALLATYKALPSLERWWTKALVASPILLLVAATAISRVNVYEQMFAPMPTKPGYSSVAEATHLSKFDKVLGVRVGDEAAAYPVGIVEYHHVVNDELAGEPFVVTY